MAEIELQDFLNQQTKDDEFDSLREVLQALSRKNKVYRLSQLDGADKAFISRLMLLETTLFSKKKRRLNSYITNYMDICVSETEDKSRSLINILADIVSLKKNEQPILYGGSPEIKG